MASTIKCKACKSENEKYSEFCSKCGKPLFRQISYKTANVVTITLDIIFALLYIIGAVLLVLKSSSIVYSEYTRMLPIANSAQYYIILVYLLLQSISKIFFVFNFFFIKHTLAFSIRRVCMYIEGITMFPLQAILGLYFYSIALDEKKVKFLGN